MTREEIIDFCDMQAQLEPENEDVFNAIIKALEQEPTTKNCRTCGNFGSHHGICEICKDNKCWIPTTKNDLGVDAVSRREVLYLIADNDLSMGQVVRGIHALPSVTPQEPRKGHWISTETKGVRYAFWCRYKCSLCGEHSDHTNFCPDCGADMREVEV